jgi:hypothetical protein
VHSAVCGGGRGEVCGNAASGADVGQAHTAVAVRDGELRSQRSVLLGQAQEGKHAIHSLALRSLNSVPHMLPWTASRQLCHGQLEAAVEQKPEVLVGQPQGLKLLHQLAGEVSTSINKCRLD